MTALTKIERFETTKSIPQQHKSYFPSEKEMNEMVNITKTLATCPYYQKLGPGGVLAIWLTAREMELPPMMCLNGGLYTFSGQVTMSSKLMNMMITRAGHRVDILESSTSKCRLRFWRSDRPKGNDSMEWEYTIEDAKTANLLNKTNWKTNTRDMLFNRCMSGGAGKFMADVTMGAYLIGEMPGDDELLDTIPDEIKTVSKQNEKVEDVKPFYSKTINTAEILELAHILAGCSEIVQKNFMDYIKTRFKIELLDDLPESEYEKTKNMLSMRRDEYQAEKTKNDNKVNEDTGEVADE